MLERMTGIEPALSAWERDSGSPLLWLWARSSWFYVVELRRSGEISYTASYAAEFTGYTALPRLSQLTRSALDA